MDENPRHGIFIEIDIDDWIHMHSNYVLFWIFFGSTFMISILLKCSNAGLFLWLKFQI